MSHHITRRSLLAAASLALAGAMTLCFDGAAVAAPAGPSAPPASGDWAGLGVRAAKDGTVPVIVSLRSPAETGAPSYAAQRDGLLGKFAKRPTAFRSLDGAPFASLHATAADLAVLKSSAQVASVVADQVFRTAGTNPFGSAAGQQLASQWDYPRIGADWANANGWTGAGMKIVVIDTGVDRNNPYLSGRVVNEACFATNTNGTGNCNNGATYEYSTTAVGIPGSASNCTYSASCAHGTHVAHTAAGKYGVARGARIIAIRASHPEWDAASASYVPLFSLSDEINALWYVYSILPKAGIVPAAINMSIGGGQYTGYCDDSQSWITYYINRLKFDYQVPTVISSGNNNFANAVGSPACNSNAISVGNSTLTAASGGIDAVYGNVSNGSNSNATLDLLAPGTDICSAVPAALDNDGTRNGWQCGWIGTSMAAPQVAGALAILTQKRPTATVDQLLAALQKAGTTGGVSIYDSRNGVTRTRINVANAVYYNI